MQEKLSFLLFFAFVNVGTLLMLAKFGVIKFYQLHRRAWMPTCNFCLFFWAAFIELYVNCEGSFSFHKVQICFLMALAAAAISRKLL